MRSRSTLAKMASVSLLSVTVMAVMLPPRNHHLDPDSAVAALRAAGVSAVGVVALYLGGSGTVRFGQDQNGRREHVAGEHCPLKQHDTFQ